MQYFFIENNENFNCYKTLWDVVSLYGHVKGQILFDTLLKSVLLENSKSKLSCVCTDGAKVITGKIKGRYKKNEFSCPFIRCVIHQEALFAKELKMVNVMSTCVKIINKITGGHNSLTQEI